VDHAIGNDYSYDDAFVRQLANYGQAGDVLITISVSGNSPNLVKVLEWGKAHDLRTIALVGAKRGRCAELAEQVLVVGDTHYGRVEDAPHARAAHALLRIRRASRDREVSVGESRATPRDDKPTTECARRSVARFTMRRHFISSGRGYLLNLFGIILDKDSSLEHLFGVHETTRTPRRASLVAG